MNKRRLSSTFLPTANALNKVRKTWGRRTLRNSFLELGENQEADRKFSSDVSVLLNVLKIMQCYFCYVSKMREQLRNSRLSGLSAKKTNRYCQQNTLLPKWWQFMILRWTIISVFHRLIYSFAIHGIWTWEISPICCNI